MNHLAILLLLLLVILTRSLKLSNPGDKTKVAFNPKKYKTHSVAFTSTVAADKRSTSPVKTLPVQPFDLSKTDFEKFKDKRLLRLIQADKQVISKPITAVETSLLNKPLNQPTLNLKHLNLRDIFEEKESEPSTPISYNDADAIKEKSDSDIMNITDNFEPNYTDRFLESKSPDNKYVKSVRFDNYDHLTRVKSKEPIISKSGLKYIAGNEPDRYSTLTKTHEHLVILPRQLSNLKSSQLGQLMQGYDRNKRDYINYKLHGSSIGKDIPRFVLNLDELLDRGHDSEITQQNSPEDRYVSGFSSQLIRRPQLNFRDLVDDKNDIIGPIGFKPFANIVGVSLLSEPSIDTIASSDVVIPSYLSAQPIIPNDNNIAPQKMNSSKLPYFCKSIGKTIKRLCSIN